MATQTVGGLSAGDVDFSAGSADGKRLAKVDAGDPRQCSTGLKTRRYAESRTELENPMDRFLQDLRHAVRMLQKTPAFTAVVILTLAVGIGANTAMFTVVNAVLLEQLPIRDPDRVVDLNEVEIADRSRGAIAPANFVDWRASAQSFESMSVYMRRTFNVAFETGEPERLRGVSASTSFFDTLGIAPVLGRAFTAADAEPGQDASIVLSHAFWQRRFGGRADAIGKTVRINGRPHTVVGVMPASFNFPQEAGFWTPAAYDLPSADGSDPRGDRDSHYLWGLARLKPGVTIAQANAELATIGGRLAEAYPDTNANFEPIVRPLQTQLVGAARTPLLVLFGAVAFVLLIVVANVANLLLARATVRGRELAIRAAIGADRRTLVRQLLTESLLLSLAGGVLGVLLAFWGVDLILALDPGEVPRITPIAIDGTVLFFGLAVSLVTGVLFGVVPAWQASCPDLQGTLRDQARGTTGDGGRHLARAGLVMAEVAISLVLLVGAGLLFRSLISLLDVPLGFSTGGVLTLQVSPAGESYREPAQVAQYWERVLDRVRALPGAERVALTDAPPLISGFTITTYLVDGRPALPPSQQPLSHLVRVSPDYFSTLGIPVLRGREFERADAVTSPRTIVINEAMARREFPGQDPIGQRFAFESDADGAEIWLEIVGVVGDVRQYGADQPPVPMTYAVHTSPPASAMTVLVRAAHAPALSGPLSAALQAIDPSLPLGQARTLDQVVGMSLTQRRFNVTLLTVFAGIALALAVAGIYGTVAYAVAQRTQEIGIRLALGAHRREILGLVLADALKPVAAGLVIGVVAALALSSALDRLVYGVSTTDPVTFGLLPAFLGVVALLASAIPAVRATRVDPMAALRTE